ncbi:MAG TPA: hypothetical protein VF247_01975, partial [Candidatus Krumholzibacteria bacterium]
MNKRTARLLVLVLPVLAASCASPEAPVPPDGQIVFRFERGASSLAAGRSKSLAYEPFDSVVVRVFRAGPAIVEETSRGVALAGTDPIEVSLRCLAENHKRVSVELFNARIMSYHGANTDVNVAAGKQTAVPVDAYEFVVDSLEVAPQTVVTAGTNFILRWDAAAAATTYLVQASPDAQFGSIGWEQETTDTTISYRAAAGTHYVRVIPRTLFARGHATAPKFCYVTDAGGKIRVSALVPSRVIPGELFAIVGQNLDYPGTTATIGGLDLPVEHAVWDTLVVRLPREALTNPVTVTCSNNPDLESDISDKPVVALRVAYVTSTGLLASEYVTELEKRSADFHDSGVAVIPIAELDTRDMDVFDVIAVAHDTGTLPTNWGGNPARAAVIAATDANVLAIGRGGATFLDLVIPGFGYPSSSLVDGDRKYYAPDESDQVFNTPHSVPKPDVGVFDVAPATIALSISGPYPANVDL